VSVFVLVHGIGHGAWCWKGTSDRLRRRGHQVVAVDLPLTGLDADAETVRQALDDVDPPAVLVGHSYGGLVISKAAGGRDDIDHLVYVAAIMLDGDDDVTARFAQFPPTPLSTLTELTEDGYLIVPPDAAVACFYNECEAHEARQAAERMRPTTVACLVTTGVEPWRTIPSTYVVCERDRAVHADMQRWMSTRAATVVSFDTDHSPLMSTPDRLVDLLDQIATGPRPKPIG
jgi:pimeloyl-ACP methyl ester carboxylesterase